MRINVMKSSERSLYFGLMFLLLLSTCIAGTAKNDDVELIGRAITWEDSALMLDFNPDSEEQGSELEQNILRLVRGSFGVKGWELKTPLHKQEPEVIDFIYELIK